MRILLLLFLWGASAVAEVENPLVLPLGDRESMMGNSGVSITGSAGNIFYNPAGLYRLTGRKFSASGSAYAYVKGRVTVAERAINFDTIAAVPNMVAVTRRIRSWTVGFGIFSPIAFEGTIDTEQAMNGLKVSLNNSFRTEEQYIGFASGKDIGNGWAFGLGLFGHRYVKKEMTNIFATPDTSPFHLTQNERTELEVLGLLPVIGLQKDITEKLRYGMRIAVPDIQLMGRSTVHSETLFENGGTVTVSRVRKESGGHYRLPFDVVNGLSWTPNGKHFVTLDVGVGFPTEFDSMPGQEKGYFYKTKTVVRQNLGYEYHFTDDYSLVAGLSRSPSAAGDSREKNGNPIPTNNFFGATLGFYSREKVATSGLGLFWLNSRTSDLVVPVEREKKVGFQVYGVVLTTSIDY